VASPEYSCPHNQPAALCGYDAWASDPVLRAAVHREGGGWVEETAHAMGTLVASERLQLLADAANRNVPQLKTHDRFGDRIDEVDYHPAYHELMSLAFGAGLHALAWTSARDGSFVARAALNYLWNQAENGTACPVTMSFAAMPLLRTEPSLLAEWAPKLTACAYDRRLLPVAQKSAVTMGMAMTERQGGSDLRGITTRAIRSCDGFHVLEGQKWFCSAPMSDAFFTLARTQAGIGCFLVPRSLPDGARNAFLIQRLKDKCGNRSNASCEVEFRETLAYGVGDPGRGIATLIEMAHFTRFDIVVATAGMMRALLIQALHHARHREAFGRPLIDHGLMKNVIADLALESQAAALLAFRLAAAFDRSAVSAPDRDLVRILTPVAKYWLCKRTPALAAEAMECLGGNGYVEEAALARLYREAPLNGIWEGSGNVICLDVLRSLARHPSALESLVAEVRAGGPRLAQVARDLERQLRCSSREAQARRLVECAALSIQMSLMERHAPAPAADAFCQTRLEHQGGRHFGTLPGHTDLDAIIRSVGEPPLTTPAGSR
jgi:putative acyl-CoA dehydrogenase